MSHFDDMIFDLMHISKREYDLLTQRNSDLEIHTDCLIRENSKLKKENKKLREDNVFLRSEIEELNEVIRNKNNEIDELKNKIRILDEDKEYLLEQSVKQFIKDYPNKCLKDNEIKLNITIKRDDDDE